MKKRNLEESPRDTNYKKLKQQSRHSGIVSATLSELEYLKKDNEDLKKRLDRQFKRQNRNFFNTFVTFGFQTTDAMGSSIASKLIMAEYDDNMFDENADFFSIKNKVFEIWEKIKEEKKKKEEKERREKLEIYNEIRQLFEACDDGKLDEVKKFCENSNISKKDLITKEYTIQESRDRSCNYWYGNSGYDFLEKGNKTNAILIINKHMYDRYPLIDEDGTDCDKTGERRKYWNNIVLIAKYFSTILYPNPTELEKKYLYRESAKDYMCWPHANPICSPFFSALVEGCRHKPWKVDDIKLFIQEKGIEIINEYRYGQNNESEWGELIWTNAIDLINLSWHESSPYSWGDIPTFLKTINL